MTDMSGVLHEMELIKFLLKSSPVLEIMSIKPCAFVRDTRQNMLIEMWTDTKLNMLIELLRFRRASAQAEIVFVQD